jgi:hypothetical protein
MIPAETPLPRLQLNKPLDLFGCSVETVFQQDLLAKTPASAGTAFKKQRLCSVTKTMM